MRKKKKTISLELAFFAKKQEAPLVSGFVRKRTQWREDNFKSREAIPGYKHSSHHSKGSKTWIRLGWIDKSLHVDSVDPIDF